MLNIENKNQDFWATVYAYTHILLTVNYIYVYTRMDIYCMDSCLLIDVKKLYYGTTSLRKDQTQRECQGEKRWFRGTNKWFNNDWTIDGGPDRLDIINKSYGFDNERAFAIKTVVNHFSSREMKGGGESLSSRR